MTVDFILEQLLGFALSTNLVREIKHVSKFQTNCIATFHVIDNSHSDKLIHFIIQL